jgi:hypothetical protein
MIFILKKINLMVGFKDFFTYVFQIDLYLFLSFYFLLLVSCINLYIQSFYEIAGEIDFTEVQEK